MHSSTSIGSDSPGSPSSAMCAPVGPATAPRNDARSSWWRGASPAAATCTAPITSPMDARQRARTPGCVSGSTIG
jgi:hypothetical protein